eukprot:2133575-Karenia_brevis.AAC.1
MDAPPPHLATQVERDVTAEGERENTSPPLQSETGIASEQQQARLANLGRSEVAYDLDTGGVPPQVALHMLSYAHVSSLPQ